MARSTHSQIGDDEVLLDDVVRLAEGMTLAGSQVTRDVWQLYATYVPERQRAIDLIGAFLQPHLRGTSVP